MKGTQTEKNLLIAFAGESKARNVYQMFADVARKEGYVKIALVFEDVALHEISHAKNFQKFFENTIVEINQTVSVPMIGTTIENLKQAISGELFEAETLYPQFAEIAKSEGFTKVASKFKLIANAEKYHLKLFKKYLQKLESDSYFKNQESIEWYCIKCGYTHFGENAPQECPACNHPQAYFTPTE